MNKIETASERLNNGLHDRLSRSKRYQYISGCCVLLLGMLLFSVSTLEAATETTLVSLSSGGDQGNSSSIAPSVSADGRYVAFESSATNLVLGDTNGVSDVFVHDRQSEETSRVSVASDGIQGNLSSTAPSISADGRYVVFESGATNLVLADTNGISDIFVHDRQTEETTRVSVASDGTQGNLSSSAPSISADGRYVVFESDATNLVLGDGNAVPDIFFHDRLTGDTSRVSVTSDGGQGNNSSTAPSLSADGRYLVFQSIATNLVSGDTNGTSDIFFYDRETEDTTRVSVASGGDQGNDSSLDAAISSAGRYVAFASLASNLVEGDINGVLDVFVHDRQTGNTTRVSVASNSDQGNDLSLAPTFVTREVAVSTPDRRFVAFASLASNLVEGDTNGVFDVFVHDREAGDTTRVSVASDSEQGNSSSTSPRLSAEGEVVVFQSDAGNLVSGDTNGVTDIFVYESTIVVSKRVDININPDCRDNESDDNCLETDEDGVIPVAILGAEDFDVGNIDVNTLLLQAPEVGVRSRIAPFCSIEYCNNDNYIDMVCYFVDNPDERISGTTTGKLTGNLLDGTAIEGTDSICNDEDDKEYDDDD